MIVESPGCQTTRGRSAAISLRTALRSTSSTATRWARCRLPVTVERHSAAPCDLLSHDRLAGRLVDHPLLVAAIFHDVRLRAGYFSTTKETRDGTPLTGVDASTTIVTDRHDFRWQQFDSPPDTSCGCELLTNLLRARRDAFQIGRAIPHFTRTDSTTPPPNRRLFVFRDGVVGGRPNIDRDRRSGRRHFARERRPDIASSVRDRWSTVV